MKKNKSLQILVPFIVNKIERNYDVSEENGAAKKNLYLMVIDSLNNNKYVNLEYHVEVVYHRNTSCSRYCYISSLRQR